MKRKKSLSRDLVIFIIVSLVVSVVTILPELALYFDNDDIFKQVFHLKISSVVLGGVSSFVVMMILFVSNSSIFKFNDPSKKIGGLELVLSFLFIFVATLLLREASEELIFWNQSKEDMDSGYAIYHVTHFLRDVITAVIVFGTSFGMYYVRKQHMMAMQYQELQTENAKNRYESLKSQLNPHMLFNSLNTLSTVVDESSEKAQEYIQGLSYVLRYTLQSSENMTVDVEEEIRFSLAYLFLQKMRYEDNLRYEINISDAAKRKVMPPMSLQLLIENAIKHNQVSSKTPLTIDIHTENDEWLVVSNIIRPKFDMRNADTMGIGLKNLNRRYELLFDRNIIIDKQNGEFTVRIPLVEPDKNIGL